MLLTLICFLTGFESVIWAHLGEPIFTRATLFTFSIETSTVFRPTACFISSGKVSQCRRKRGIEEKPHVTSFGDQESIIPSAVIGIEATLQFRDPNGFASIFSSLEDQYSDSQDISRQLEINGRSKSITVGDCGQSTVNFSQFLSCLGLNVQETTTLTATYTETMTVSTGYTTIGVVWGCTPVGFPYVFCREDDETESSSEINVPTVDEEFTFPFISMGIDGSTSNESHTSEFPTYLVSEVDTTDMSSSISTTDEAPLHISVSSTGSGESSGINYPSISEAVDFVNFTTSEENSENSNSPVSTTYPLYFQPIQNETTDASATDASVSTDTVSGEVSANNTPTVSETTETIDFGNSSTFAIENSYSTASTTNEFPNYLSSFETISNDTTELSIASTTNSNEIPFRPVFTTISDESAAYSTFSSETISISDATINMDGDVTLTSPSTSGTDHGGFTIYPSVSETVENDDTTEEGLT